jgi:hypothetical protein
MLFKHTIYAYGLSFIKNSIVLTVFNMKHILVLASIINISIIKYAAY